MNGKRKVLIYDRDKMQKAGQLLNVLKLSGVDNFRIASELSFILDSGEPAEMEAKKEEKKDVVHK